MFDMELKRYEALNELAEHGGIVIFGGTEDTRIPLGELKQAFAIEEKVYNRSVKELSVLDACRVYEACAASLLPETVLLHIGEEDLLLFKTDAAKFDYEYNTLIMHIKAQNKNCRIGVVSLRNYGNDVTITELNKHLKYIADSNCCEYVDIAKRRIWNPKSTKDAVSFVYSIGFVRPLKNKRSLYDFIKIFFASLA